MTDLIQIQEYDFNGSQEQAVSAKSLYQFLGLSKTNYGRWFAKTIISNGDEGTDYILCHFMDDEASDAVLSLDFAKTVSMMSNSVKGKVVRQYFLNIEKAYKKVVQIVKPRTTIEMLEEAVLALKAKDRELVRLETTNRQLNDTNAQKISLLEKIRLKFPWAVSKKNIKRLAILEIRHL